ncbi:hypothetical protein [Azospirillum sp. B510]|uniref:hypothetical protein n=1 Tax=Azospirillum sp. (strain B510) TaxID=137722 RepID=UPI0011D07C08|nr:hypothetical protein [Azospirillum sp. B510]
MNLKTVCRVLRDDLGAVKNRTEFDVVWLSQKPGYTRSGAGPRRASLVALLRLAARLDALAAARVVPVLRDLRAALAVEIANRVATDAR